MKQFTLSLFALGLAALSQKTALAQSVPDQHTVEPGVRIGRIFLGDTRAAVRRRLGKPGKTFNLGRGLSSDLWRSKKTYGTSGQLNTLEVVYRGNVVTQIEATNPIFKTRDGIGLYSSLGRLDEKYGEAKWSRYRYTSRGIVQNYQDWTRAGVAVEHLEGQSDLAPVTLIVHRRGVPVVVDRGGVRIAS